MPLSVEIKTREALKKKKKKSPNEKNKPPKKQTKNPLMQ